MSAIRHLYFAGIIPPDDIFAEIHAFRERMAEKYNSRAAMRSPVHITLVPPLELPEDVEDRYIALLGDIASRHHPFEVRLNGFGAFPPRVIYVKPEKQLRLNTLAREIVDTFMRHIASAMELQGFRFNAHMTIAFRDLTADMFPAAWSEFKNKSYTRSFEATEVSLLKHDGKKWNVIHRSKLARAKDEDQNTLGLFT